MLTEPLGVSAGGGPWLDDTLCGTDDCGRLRGSGVRDLLEFTELLLELRRVKHRKRPVNLLRNFPMERISADVAIQITGLGAVMTLSRVTTQHHAPLLKKVSPSART